MTCTCKGPMAERRSNWRVSQRLCNHSAFNGYHRTPSAYSEVFCKVCSARWRTTAAYVKNLWDELL